jgi:hypothetical protein
LPARWSDQSNGCRTNSGEINAARQDDKDEKAAIMAMGGGIMDFVQRFRTLQVQRLSSEELIQVRRPPKPAAAAAI